MPDFLDGPFLQILRAKFFEQGIAAIVKALTGARSVFAERVGGDEGRAIVESA